MKKRQSKPVAEVVEARQGYVTYMEYFATGEGMTYEIQHCWAVSPEDAIEQHLTDFGIKDKKSRDYFRVGIVAYGAESLEVKELLKRFLKDGEKLFYIMQDASVRLHVKLHWNFS